MKKSIGIVILVLSGVMLFLLMGANKKFTDLSDSVMDKAKNSFLAFNGHVQFYSYADNADHLKALAERLQNDPATEMTIPIVRQQAVLLDGSNMIPVELYVVPDADLTNIPALKSMSVNLQQSPDGHILLLNETASMSLSNRRGPVLLQLAFTTRGQLVKTVPISSASLLQGLDNGPVNVPKAIINESYYRSSQQAPNYKLSLWLKDGAQTWSKVDELKGIAQGFAVNSWLDEKGKVAQALREERSVFKSLFISLLVPLLLIILTTLSGLLMNKSRSKLEG